MERNFAARFVSVSRRENAAGLILFPGGEGRSREIARDRERYGTMKAEKGRRGLMPKIVDLCPAVPLFAAWMQLEMGKNFGMVSLSDAQLKLVMEAAQPQAKGLKMIRRFGYALSRLVLLATGNPRIAQFLELSSSMPSGDPALKGFESPGAVRCFPRYPEQKN
jgi:hypothetical protein